MACCSSSSSSAAAAAAVGRVGAVVNRKGRRGGCGRVMCVSTSPPHSSSSSSSGLCDQYKMLRIRPGASELEVKKAFRQLALKYHPDVCKGSDCGVQFHRINEAYDSVMANLRASEEENEDQMGGTYNPSWELWEEWMGFEGACTTDYSAHINPYI